jgi:hypothetical protein
MFISIVSGCSTVFYEAGPINGAVVDSETGVPIEGAVVVAFWRLEGGYHAYRTKLLEVQEVITDHNGQYHLPGLNRRYGTVSSSAPSSTPEVFIFKFNYLPQVLRNVRYDRSKVGAEGAYHGSTIHWSGNDRVELQQLKGSGTDNYVQYSRSGLPRKLPSITVGCRWKKLKMLILEVDKQEWAREKDYYLTTGKEKEPWFMRFTRQSEVVPDCPGAVEMLLQAREDANA